jgi:hypothetical protein
MRERYAYGGRCGRESVFQVKSGYKKCAFRFTHDASRLITSRIFIEIEKTQIFGFKKADVYERSAAN